MIRRAVRVVLPSPGRCRCGATASWERPIFGTKGGRAHVWAGCAYCLGTAVSPSVPAELYDEAVQRDELGEVW